MAVRREPESGGHHTQPMENQCEATSTASLSAAPDGAGWVLCPCLGLPPWTQHYPFPKH